MSPTPSVAVVILAGGEGRRMGGAKPQRMFRGRPLISHALDAARGWSDAVAVAVRTTSQTAGLPGLQMLTDPPGLEGPLAGLAAALEHGRRLGVGFVLTAPCDAPCLPADLAARLVAAVGNAPAALAMSCGRLHPACGLWRPACAGELPAYLAGGRRSLHGFAEHLGFAVADWGACDPDPFVNLNTPAELMALEGGFRPVGRGRMVDATGIEPVTPSV